MPEIHEPEPKLVRWADPGELQLEPYEEAELWSADAELPTARVKWLGGQAFELRRDCTIPDSRHGAEFTVPAGFVFDAASVPRIVWPLISALDCGVLAVLAHDWLYAQGGDLAERTYTRHEADLLFLDLMEAEEVPAWRRSPAYRAVRLFGGKAWQG
jgi:hypothetical protein